MEFLKKFITPELYAQLEAELKDKEVKLGNLTDGSYVAKAKYNAEASKVTDLTSQLAERNTQLDELGKSAGDSEALKKQIADLQTANTTAQTEWANKLKKQAFDFALNGELASKYKAKDVKSIMPHLNAEAITYQDGKFIGLDEQMTSLVKDKAFLFGDDSIGAGTGNPADPSDGTNGGNAWDFDFTAVRKTEK